MKLHLLVCELCVALLLCVAAKAQGVAGRDTLPSATVAPVKDTADTTFTIRQIQITGNRRTRASTIQRELSFTTGESYPLPEVIVKLEETKRQLMNTGLFRTVAVYVRSLQGRSVYLNIDVVEKWYLYPQPFLRVANGTFSQWNERGRPLDQVNYGIKFTQYNVTGRNDKINLHLMGGYTKRVALQYQGFYFDKALKWSGNISVAHGKNRELNYATEFNRLLPVKDPDGYIYEFWQGGFDVTYRPAIKTRHTFSVGYNYNKIADTVSKLNPHYSPSKSLYKFFYLNYTVSFTDLDFNPYPTRGMAGDVSLYKAGVNNPINLWQLALRGTKYWPLSHKAYFNVRASALLRVPFKQPYIVQQYIGYGDAFLQGYENYIIDGVAGGYTKLAAGYNVLNATVPVPVTKYNKNFRSFPLRLYVRGYANAGYIHNPNPALRNELTNRMLYSTGVALDVIAFTDFVFKIEWSFNRLGQNAIYLHQQNNY